MFQREKIESHINNQIMKITVTNCDNCPFCSIDGEVGPYCNHTYDDIERTFDKETRSFKETVLPDNCPLRDEEITVSLGLLV